MTDMNFLFFMVAQLSFIAGALIFFYKVLKSDIDGLRAELKSDIDGLRTELKSDIDGLRIMTIRNGEDISEIRGILVGARFTMLSRLGQTK